MKNKRLKIGKNMEKILFLLLAGVTIGLSKSKTTAYFVIKNIPKELQKIDRRCLNRAIVNLYKSKLVDTKEDQGGNIIMTLNENGKRKILAYNFDKLKFKKHGNWDHLWRIIIFDIPEELKKERDALAKKLKSAGAYPLQKSVFVYPYDIKNELDFLIEFFNLRKYVRFIVAKEIDNELHLKKIFNLI